MLVTRLVCDREVPNSLMSVFVFSRALVCQIQVAREFQGVTNKKHARVIHASVKFKSSSTVYQHYYKVHDAIKYTPKTSCLVAVCVM